MNPPPVVDVVAAIAARDFSIVFHGRYVNDSPETRDLASFESPEPTVISDNHVSWDNLWCADYHGYLNCASIEFPSLGKRLVFSEKFSGIFVTGSEFSIALTLGYTDLTDTKWEAINEPASAQ